MAKGKVVFLSRDVEPELKELFYKYKLPDVDMVMVKPDEAQAVSKELSDADVLVSLRSGRIPEKLLESAKRLKLLHTTGQGTDHVPVRFATEKGIFVCNAGGGNAETVAEFTVLLVLAVMRRLIPYAEQIRKGNFRGEGDIRQSHELYDKTVGVVGLGNIGRRVANLVHAFGANVVYFKRTYTPLSLVADFQGRRVSLEELVKTSDVVTLHVPLTESTRHLIGWEQFSMMKPTAYFINTSRGAVVDEAALIRALKEKRIAGAAVDVFDPEPPSPDNPLLHMDNVIATPHIGATAWENWEPRIKVIWGNIGKVTRGETPLNTVDES